ncbi:MAG: RAMP superfamily CRISPR-associated protein [Bacteroidales bacterium]|nr:RAMP superfamily CRISPR-associated protein [Bacteroidales bacterium]
MEDSKYKYRYLAKVVIGAVTPLSIGSGTKDIMTDSIILKDCNGLPYIPGTSIAGVLRHYIDEANNQLSDKISEDKRETKYFGYQLPFKDKSSQGSEIIFSDAKMVGTDGKAIDGLKKRSDLNTDYLQRYVDLPVRQHVKINHRGVTDNHGKFDEQIVYAGTRFCFEIELLASEKEISAKNFKQVLDVLQSGFFRIGGGTRKGFGAIEVKKNLLETAFLDFESKEEKFKGCLKEYISKSSNLSEDWDGYNKYPFEYSKSDILTTWQKYILVLEPEDFMMFGSGFADNEVDMTPVKGFKVVWKDDKSPEVQDNKILIPATSLKGAIRHRVAFHWNKITGDRKECDKNDAVLALFGPEGSEKDCKNQKRGNVIFSDIIEDKSGTSEKILNHVAIDRFTGGAIDGALFSEKTIYAKGKKFVTEIYVNTSAFEDKDGNIIKAFEDTLDDIKNGLLPLGGGVNRGNGIFGGDWSKQ